MSNTISWAARRALTDNPKTPKETLRQTGRALLEAGLAAEAFNFFKAADDRQACQELADLAAAEGDFFLYRQVAAFLGAEEAGSGRLRSLIDAAERQGLGLYAEKARQFLADNFR